MAIAYFAFQGFHQSISLFTHQWHHHLGKLMPCNHLQPCRPIKLTKPKVLKRKKHLKFWPMMGLRSRELLPVSGLTCPRTADNSWMDIWWRGLEDSNGITRHHTFMPRMEKGVFRMLWAICHLRSSVGTKNKPQSATTLSWWFMMLRIHTTSAEALDERIWDV